MKLTKEQKLFKTIVEKAWEDADFKAALQRDPVNAIEALTGERLNIPAGKTMKVYDQTDQTKVYINIPAEPSMDDMELTDEQLEIVAGGGDPLPVIQGLTEPDPNPLGGTTTGG